MEEPYEGPVEQIPCQRLAVPRETRALGRLVQQIGGFAQPAAHQQHRRECLGEHRQQLSLPGSARDAQTSPAVRGRLLEAIQVRLGACEVRHRVEADGKFGVGHGVDEGRRLGAVNLGFGDGFRERADECADGQRCGGQRPLAERPSDLERARSPCTRVFEVLPEESVQREVDHERCSLRRSLVVERLERTLEAGVRLLVPTEKLLDASARCGQAHT